MERGQIQVRHGPGPDVEVLPLTMVNMMQSLNSEPLMQNDSRSTEGVDGLMGRPCVNEDTETQQLDAQVSGSNSDTSGDCDKECQRPKPISDESEFENTELEELVLMEGPQQILQLTLQEQADNFMREEITDANDYVDWIKWVADAEQKKQTLADGLNHVEVPVLLQVQQLNDAPLCNNFRDQIVSTDDPRVSSRWEDICQKLYVD